MLKEISKEIVLNEIQNGKEVYLYHTKLKRMFTSTELIECCRFLLDEEIEVSEETTQVTEIQPNIHSTEDAVQSTTQNVDIKEESSYTAENNSKENILELNQDSEETTDLDLGEIKHTPNNDVKTEVIDTGSDDEIDYNDLIPGKKGRKITIDLGKLYSLRRAKWTIKDIAYELNCSVATVNKYVNNKELEQKVIEMQSNK